MSKVKNTSVLDLEGQSTALQCYEVKQPTPKSLQFHHLLVSLKKGREGGVKKQ